ncbi:acyltransferase family protein [Enterobacter sp. C2]|uniref:acyltransferase family protein n=1 Tax=Enterobacter sp. C2 TaxID=2870346 RepID=UPI001CA41FA2|nr:acyltransferase family protein [Enterobacter sp. C2]
MWNILKVAGSLHNDKYRSDIDGIRALAVLLVVICHAFPEWFPKGFIGVDIFFVISGFLISSILIKDAENNKFSIKRFYQRRIRRIAPALITVLLSTLMLSWWCLFKPEYLSLGKHFIASLLFSENFLLWSEVSYFDIAAELKPTLHLWSLAVEEQFYIVWPIIIYLAYRMRWNLLYACLIMTVLSFILNTYHVHHNPTAAYYSPLERSWELMVGAILAIVQHRYPNALSKFKNGQSALGVVFIIVGLVVIKPARFPGAAALLPTLGTFFLLSAGSKSWINRNILSLSPVVWLGFISYPLYLWHWPLLSLTRITFGPLTALNASLCLIVSVLAAFLTVVIVEVPARRSQAPVKWLLIMLAFIFALSIMVATGSLTPRIKSNAIPTKNEWAFLEDSLEKKYDNSTGEYTLGKGVHDIIFIGDSHVAQYAPYLDKKLSEMNQSASLYVGGGCIPIVGVSTTATFRKTCANMIKSAFNEASNDRYKTVVIGGAWNRYFLAQDELSRDYLYKDNYINTGKGMDLALSRLQEDIVHLQNLHKNVVLILDNPKQSYFLTDRNRLVLQIKNGMVAPRNKEHRKLNEYLKSYFMRLGVRVINPAESVCGDNTVCYITDAYGNIIYKDTDHFNPDWIVNNGGFLGPIWQR